MIALALLAAQATTAPIAASPTVLTAIDAPAIPREQRAAAETLVDLTGVDATVRAASVKQVDLIRSGAPLSAQLDLNPAIRVQRSKNPQAWDAAIKRIAAKQADAIAAIFAEMTPEIREQAVRAYATNFTLAQLHQLAAFYRTPLGRALVDHLPAITEQTTNWAQQELPRRIAPSIAALQPELQRELTPLMAQPAK